MKIDLKSMSRKELEKLQADVEKALAKVSQRELKAAREAAAKAAAAHGFSLADITNGVAEVKTKATKKAPKVASAPKYKNPHDHSQTWTGKGRQPDWFKTAIAAGKSPDTMAI